MPAFIFIPVYFGHLVPQRHTESSARPASARSCGFTASAVWFYSGFLMNNWCSLYSHPQWALIRERAADPSLETAKNPSEVSRSVRRRAVRVRNCSLVLHDVPFVNHHRVLGLLRYSSVRLRNRKWDSNQSLSGAGFFPALGSSWTKSESADESFCVWKNFCMNHRTPTRRLFWSKLHRVFNHELHSDQCVICVICCVYYSITALLQMLLLNQQAARPEFKIELRNVLISPCPPSTARIVRVL